MKFDHLSTKGLCAASYFDTLRNTPNIFLPMITCHLSTLMGREKLRVADVARLTGLNRSTVSALYKGTCTRVEIAAVDELCALFKCQVGDIFQFIGNQETGNK